MSLPAVVIPLLQRGVFGDDAFVDASNPMRGHNVVLCLASQPPGYRLQLVRPVKRLCRYPANIFSSHHVLRPRHVGLRAVSLETAARHLGGQSAPVHCEECW